MSAYSVSDKHLAYLTSAGMHYRVLVRAGHNPGGFMTVSEVFAMLRTENNASLAARYPNDPDMQMPLASEFALTPYVKSVQTLKAIAGYEYQACEHEGWQTSKAKRFCQELERAAIRALPGYDDAAWEIV